MSADPPDITVTIPGSMRNNVASCLSIMATSVKSAVSQARKELPHEDFGNPDDALDRLMELAEKIANG